MSGTFPSSPMPTLLTLKSVQPTLVSVTHSLRRQVRSRGAQRWGLVLEYRDRSRAEMAPLLAFALAQRGQYESFQIVPALLGAPQGTAGGTPLTSGAQAAGLRSVTTDGWSAGATLKAGDLLKFAGHSKVYVLTADATADGSGAATLALEPALMAALADNESITVSDVPMTCAFDADQHEWPLQYGARMDWQTELVEAY